MTLFLTHPVYAELHFELNTNITLTENKVFLEYLKRVESELPSLMVEKLKVLTIKIKFNPKLTEENDEYGSVYDENKINLDPFILKSLQDEKILSGSIRDWMIEREKYYNRDGSLVGTVDGKNMEGKKIIPKHISVLSHLDSILIHELSHLFDYLNLPYKKYLESRKQCIMSRASQSAFGPDRLDPSCNILSGIKSSVSTLPEYLHLAGWPARGFWDPKPTSINTLTAGSPNFYETKDAYESFAVNMEYFLLDPQFECHRPELFEFLKSYFNNFDPYPNTICQSTYKVLVSNTDFLSTNSNKPIYEFVDLDWKNLYQIHYFFAGKNSEMMSRFGHGMLRLVFCNPKRNKIGPDCMKDTQFHYVASFSAFIGNLEINPIDGLFGNYSAHLFMNHFDDVINTYNNTELREIYSLPLNLSSVQKEILLKGLYEAHWGYRGKYEFTSNNCSIETFSVIKDAFINSPTVFDSYVIRPDSLFELLPQLKITAGDVFKDMKYAFDYGYYFPSKRPNYERAIQVLIEKKILPEDFDLDSYVELPAIERTPYIKNLHHLKKSDLISALVASRNLEDLSMRKYSEKTLKSRLPDLVSKLDSDGKKFNINKNEVIDYIKKISIPAETLNLSQSYGIPSANLVNKEISRVVKDLDLDEIKKIKQNVINFVKSCFSTDENKNFKDFEVNFQLLK